jgi:hypothetical protein
MNNIFHHCILIVYSNLLNFSSFFSLSVHIDCVNVFWVFFSMIEELFFFYQLRTVFVFNVFSVFLHIVEHQIMERTGPRNTSVRVVRSKSSSGAMH